VDTSLVVDARPDAYALLAIEETARVFFDDHPHHDRREQWGERENQPSQTTRPAFAQDESPEHIRAHEIDRSTHYDCRCHVRVPLKRAAGCRTRTYL
jgi:hypothetical protein